MDDERRRVGYRDGSWVFDYTPTMQRAEDRYWLATVNEEGARLRAGEEEARAEFRAWLAAHDAKVRAEALREAYADLESYTDSGAPFGHRPVEEFLLHRADRIEREAGLK